MKKGCSRSAKNPLLVKLPKSRITAHHHPFIPLIFTSGTNSHTLFNPNLSSRFSKQLVTTISYLFPSKTMILSTPVNPPQTNHPSIGTILCAECWCCLSSLLLGYWAQSWIGRHSDTGYQQAGTHFADLRRMTGRVNSTCY